MRARILITALAATAFLATAQAQKTAGNVVDDSWLHTKVKTAILSHGGSGVDIEVYKGHVQLAGFIDSESRKDKILEYAGGVENVVEVHDQLVVVEPDRSAGEVLDDNVTTAAVKAALADSGFERALAVNVEVNRGAVLLSGFVDNREERDTAISVAETVENVKEVIDGMNLKPTD